MAECNISKLVEKMNINKKEDLDVKPQISKTLSLEDRKQAMIAQSIVEDINLGNSMITLPQGTKMLNTEIVYVKKHIEKPIGITMLTNGNIVVADRGQNVVKFYNPDTGDEVKTLIPMKTFRSPSDMTTLPDGRLVVRDNNGLQLFDGEGNYIQVITPQGVFGRCYGVASDNRGNILIINTNPRGNPGCVTRKGETDVLRIDFENDVILEKIELVDIISDQNMSACRFLHCDGLKVYVVDLGLAEIYVLTLGMKLVRKFGQLGKKLGEFKDPAGIAVDAAGNMIIADAGNNRLQVFDRKRNVLGIVKLNTRIERPSGIYLDQESKSLYVLNLRGNSFVKVKLLC